MSSFFLQLGYRWDSELDVGTDYIYSIISETINDYKLAEEEEEELEEC